MKSTLQQRNISTTRKVDYSLQQPKVTKLTPEMCKAIRRQELGIDYWKTGFHGGQVSNGNTSAIDRPAYSKLSHIDLNFQGAFLPSVNGNGGSVSNGSSQSQRANQRVPGTQTLVLSRSRTTMVPGLSPTKSSGRSPGTRRNTVTDLTCMQLADTLFSTRKASLSAGFFNLTPSRNKYGESVSAEKESDDDSASDISEKSWPKFIKRPFDNDRRNSRTLAALKYHTFQSGDCLDGGRAISPGGIASSDQLTTRPQKSILKNSGPRQTDDNDEASHSDNDKTFHVSSSYRLSPKFEAVGQTHEHVSLESIRPKVSRNRSIVNDLPNGRPTHGSGYSLSGMAKDLSVRKRSVRFNSSHEIREYTPHDPVYNS